MVTTGSAMGGAADRIPPTPAPVPDELRRELEELGLSPYEARTLLALLRLGSANSSQLAQLSGVPRTSLYQVLEALGQRGMAQRVAIDGPATWMSPGRDAVMDRLDANEQERLRQHQARTAHLRGALRQAFPDTPAVVPAFVNIVRGAPEVRRIYDGLLTGAEDEVLVFNRPPYSAAANPVHEAPAEIRSRDEVNPVVLATLARGITIRVLYERDQWRRPEADSFRQAMHTYHLAGVQGRVTAELPIKLAIADRRAALLALSSPGLPKIGFPTNLFIDHPGFAAVQADAFEHRWSAADPVVGFEDPR